MLCTIGAFAQSMFAVVDLDQKDREKRIKLELEEGEQQINADLDELLGPDAP